MGQDILPKGKCLKLFEQWMIYTFGKIFKVAGYSFLGKSLCDRVRVWEGFSHNPSLI